MIHVIPIPALSDNYMYLVIDEKSKKAAAVDPVEPEKIKQEADKFGVQISAALTTHHHWDHAGGNGKFVAMYPDATVYGGDERVEAVTKTVSDGDKLKIGELNVQCLSTPCHTSGHICYLVQDDKGEKAVFTGDTMFVAGCGKFFEGTAEQMYQALVVKLGSLGDNTKVFVGHEYTVNNLLYAKHADPGNGDVTKKLDWAKKTVAQGQYTVPSTIGDEKRTNPFMRVGEPALLKHAKTENPVHAMKYLRDEKNNFAAK